jgi:hypothetical protein
LRAARATTLYREGGDAGAAANGAQHQIGERAFEKSICEFRSAGRAAQVSPARSGWET